MQDGGKKNIGVPLVGSLVSFLTSLPIFWVPLSSQRKRRWCPHYSHNHMGEFWNILPPIQGYFPSMLIALVAARDFTTDFYNFAFLFSFALIVSFVLSSVFFFLVPAPIKFLPHFLSLSFAFWGCLLKKKRNF